MTHLCQRIGISLLVLVLGLAATAHAGTRMYSASLTIQGFGNDTTTGATPKYSKAGYTGIPGVGRCNAGAPHYFDTVTFPTAGAGTMTFMFTLPNYGGQDLVHDINGDGTLDVPADCATTTVRAGIPMVASGAAAYTTGTFSDSRPLSSPRKFTIAKGVFQRHQGIPPGKGT